MREVKDTSFWHIGLQPRISARHILAIKRGALGRRRGLREKQAAGECDAETDRPRITRMDANWWEAIVDLHALLQCIKGEFSSCLFAFIRVIRGQLNRGFGSRRGVMPPSFG